MRTIRRRRRDDRGATAVEYAIILGGTAIGLVAIVLGLKTTMGNALTDASNSQAVVSDGSTVAPSNGPTSVVLPPAAPSVSAAPGNGQIAITWAPVSGATSYVVTCNGRQVTVTTTNYTCTGLTNGTNYPVTVVARGPSGTSPAGGASATPFTTPGAPTNLTATPGNAQVDLSWTAPSTGGSPITGYTVTNVPTGGSCTVAGTTATCTGLTNGTTYTFTVVASNAAGDGPGATTTGKPTNAISWPRGGANWTEDYTDPNLGMVGCVLNPNRIGRQSTGSCSFTNGRRGNPDQLVFTPGNGVPVGTAVTVTWTICTAEDRRGNCTASVDVTRDFVLGA